MFWACYGYAFAMFWECFRNVLGLFVTSFVTCVGPVGHLLGMCWGWLRACVGHDYGMIPAWCGNPVNYMLIIKLLFPSCVCCCSYAFLFLLIVFMFCSFSCVFPLVLCGWVGGGRGGQTNWPEATSGPSDVTSSWAVPPYGKRARWFMMWAGGFTPLFLCSNANDMISLSGTGGTTLKCLAHKM